jgi:hypothetical protein
MLDLLHVVRAIADERMYCYDSNRRQVVCRVSDAGQRQSCDIHVAGVRKPPRNELAGDGTRRVPRTQLWGNGRCVHRLGLPA